MNSRKEESDYIVSLSKIYTSKIYLIKITNVTHNSTAHGGSEDLMLQSHLQPARNNMEDDMHSEMQSMFGNTYLSKNLRKLKVNYKDLLYRFVFKYDPLADQYTGEFMHKNKIGKGNFRDNFKRSIKKRLSKLDMSEEKKSVILEISRNGNEIKEREKIDYGRGIRIMRLRESRIGEVFDDYSDEEESEMEKASEGRGNSRNLQKKTKNSKGILNNKQVKKKNSNSSDLEDFDQSVYFNNLKRDKSLLDAVSRIHKSNYGIIMIILCLLSTVCFGVLSFILIYNEKSFYSTIVDLAKILDTTYDMFGDCSTITSSIDNLMLLQKGYPPNNLTPDILEEDAKMRLLNSTNSLTEKSQELLTLANSPGLEPFLDVLYKRSVTLIYGPTNVVNVTLRESINQLTSASINVYNLPLGSISMLNSDVVFIISNAVQGIQLYLIIEFLFNDQNESSYIEEAIKSITQVIIYIIIYCCVSFLLMFWVLYLRLKNQDKIIDLFYGYNMNDCKIISKKCEHVLQEFLAEGAENLDLNLDFLEDLDNEKERMKLRREEESEIILISRSKKKGKFARRFYIPAITIFMIFVGQVSFSFLSNFIYTSSSGVDFEISNLKFQLTRLERLVEAGTMTLKASAVYEGRYLWFTPYPFGTYLRIWPNVIARDIFEALDALSQKYQMNENLSKEYIKIFNEDFCQYLKNENLDESGFIGYKRMNCSEIYNGVLTQVKF